MGSRVLHREGQETSFLKVLKFACECVRGNREGKLCGIVLDSDSQMVCGTLTTQRYSEISANSNDLPLPVDDEVFKCPGRP